MSKIGKKPIMIPENIKTEINNGIIKIIGPKGTLTKQIPDNLTLTIKDNHIILSPNDTLRQTKILWGTLRSLVNSMVKGTGEGFSKELEYKGVGYKAVIEGKTLILSLGLSHQIKFDAPEGIEFKTEKNSIIITGPDKELVGETAAKIRSFRLPEPYKGAGIKYKDEIIRRKEGKKTVSAGF